MFEYFSSVLVVSTTYLPCVIEVFSWMSFIVVAYLCYGIAKHRNDQKNKSPKQTIITASRRSIDSNRCLDEREAALNSWNTKKIDKNNNTFYTNCYKLMNNTKKTFVSFECFAIHNTFHWSTSKQCVRWNGWKMVCLEFIKNGIMVCVHT